MAHAFVTIAIPFEDHCSDGVETCLVDKLGNPARKEIRAALDAIEAVHFMSITVVRGAPATRAHLVVEFSADGTSGSAIEQIEKAIGPQLLEVLAVAGLRPGARRLGKFLARYQQTLGQGWFSTPGLPFTGTPGMTVSRIRKEADLAQRIATLLDAAPPAGSALATLQGIRTELFSDVMLKWAFIADPAPLLAGARSILRLGAIAPILGSVFITLLWPFVAAPAAIFGFVWWLTRDWQAAVGLAAGAIVAEIGLVADAYFQLRREEKKLDVPDDLTPSADTVRDIMERENHAAQNHLFGVSTMKSGPARRFTLRFALWIIGQLGTRRARPGFLSEIGSIHFARWMLLPGTDKLLFFSNYDGSWESYLEDFIEHAHDGLTAVWSNTAGFPRTNYLFRDGAKDGDRFKRWARRQQLPTLFWYSAYPTLTTSRIRINAAIRQGVATAATEADAADWLACFGSAPRPLGTIETAKVPALAFGGLSPLRYGKCLMIKLHGGVASCRGWLRAIEPLLSYGDVVPEDSAMLVAFSSNGLERLGLDKHSLATFPVAFQHGMSAPWRARALGDAGTDHPEKWKWGGPDDEVDVFMLLYAVDAATLDVRARAREQEISQLGHGVVYELRLAPLPERKGFREKIPAEKTPLDKNPLYRISPDKVIEPFGFVDGISQPIVKGTRRSISRKDDIHAVEPGEFILGYPDNRGYLPPSPSVAASDDPANILPSLGSHPPGQRPDFTVPQPNAQHDLGRNGTYLVVRHLEQDRYLFDAFLEVAAAALDKTSGVPAGVLMPTTEWIAAKMVGRWRDGTSLVRYPHAAGTKGGKDVKPDNDFLFGIEDPNGLRCPMGAHIRRANPRDSFDPDAPEQLTIANRHRILRVGRTYEPQNGLANPGLAFMCLNADIQRQFEFVQQTWVLAPSFHGLENEIDPILGRTSETDVLTIPTAGCPVRISGLKDFVTVRGGGYFFMPGKNTIQFLSQVPPS